MEQHILVMGDMNCKFCDLINGNKEDISKGGKIKIKMMKENNMIILNSIENVEENRKEVVEGKLITDYSVIGEEYENGRSRKYYNR